MGFRSHKNKETLPEVKFNFSLKRADGFREEILQFGKTDHISAFIQISSRNQY